MLYLNPPYPIINGISLFPDHEDPLQWYYLPLAPKLTTIFDPVTNAQIPQLQVIKFRGGAGNGGFLNFDCNIGVDQKALDDVADELRSTNRNLPRGTIKLTPVPLVDGTVRMMLFGQESAIPKTTGTGGGTSSSSSSSSSGGAAPSSPASRGGASPSSTGGGTVAPGRGWTEVRDPDSEQRAPVAVWRQPGGVLGSARPIGRHNSGTGDEG